MKYSAFLSTTLIRCQAATLGILWAGMAAAATVQTVDEIVAKVNGDIVTRAELSHTAKEWVQEMKAQGMTGSKLEQAYTEREKDLLRDKIDNLLLIQKGKELSIDVTPELAKYVAELQRKSNIADPEKFREFVHQQSGLSWEDFQSEAKNSMLSRRVIGQEVSRNVSVSHKEVEDYYNQHKAEFVREEKVYLEEILISTEGKDAAGVAAAEKKAKDLAARAAQGGRFAEMARDNSDSTTAAQGGDLGGYKKGELKADLEAAVWTLPKGGVTGVIKMPNGFLILKVVEHTKEGQAELADVQAQIEEALYGPKMQPKVREYLTGLRQTAFLEIKPGYSDSGAAPGMDTTWKDAAVLKPDTITKREVETKTRKKRALWIIPIPGTETTVTGKSTSK
jgi:peptidyl-prolyl cis-trans isomerase SurA